MDFAALNFEDVSKLVTPATPLELAAQLFIEQADYYQKGTQYTGPKPSPGDPQAQQYLDQSFVGLPKLGELTGRHVDGVVGREPAFEAVTGEAEPKDARAEGGEFRTVKEEIDQIQGDWWNRENLHETTQVFASHLISSRRAYFRYDIPPGFVSDAHDQNGDLVSVVEAADWKEALGLIYVEVLEPGTGNIFVDPATREKMAVYSYSEAVGEPKDNKTQKCVQMSWLKTKDEIGQKLPFPLTVVRIVRENKTDNTVEIDTGGVLLLVEAKFHPRVFDAFVSPANVSLSNAVNCCSTSIKINVDVAAFPETRHVDIEEPVEVDESTGEETPVALEIGPRSTPFLQSSVDEVKDVATDEIRDVPRRGQIFYRQPVSGLPLIEQANFFLRGLYDATRQSHVLNDISSNASGIARVEARADYANSLLKTKPKIEGALRELLRGTRCFAAHLAGDARIEAFKAARDNVTCHANSGPLTPDEKRLVLEMLTAGTIPRELAMVMLGVEDVDAALEQIKKEEMERAFGEGYHPAMDGAAPEATGGDPNAVDENGNPVAAGVATEQGLNGAQIEGLTKLLVYSSAGILAEGAVLQALVALGIAEATAQGMITAQKTISLSPEQAAAAV